MPYENGKEEEHKILIFGGKTGWIGGHLVAECKARGLSFAVAESRLENRQDILRELERVAPTRVLNAAGLTGRPTVDWCETNKQTTIRVNVVGMLNLADCCGLYGVHMTNFATGCIYEYDDEHKMGETLGFAEDDPPNFDGSFYSKTKSIVEGLMEEYPDVLTLRVRMPIADELVARNFVTKIARYAKVVDVPNSMSVLHDLVPVALDASLRRLTGKLNFCNPGVISHNEVLELYRELVDPAFTWKNFTQEECHTILLSKRSNNRLDSSKLLSVFPDVPEIHVATRAVFMRMKQLLDKHGVEKLVEEQGWVIPERTLANMQAKA